MNKTTAAKFGPYDPMPNFARMDFKGTEHYIASTELQVVVNAAVHLQRPLLVKGEPGTGKTLLAHEIAKALGKRLITWHIKSTTKAVQGLYEYDAISRLRDSQLGSERVHDIGNYIIKGKLWEAFDSAEQVVLLIDEIDKADIEFPNDLLLELDKMEFWCHELQRTIVARHRPIVIITSNNEKELPDAFLRRCLFHFIRFPDQDQMRQIVDVHHPNLKQELIDRALGTFYRIRQMQGIKKRPATSELIDWVNLLLRDEALGLATDGAEPGKVPHLGTLIKNEQDLLVIERNLR